MSTRVFIEDTKIEEDNPFADINKDIQAIQHLKTEIQTRFITAKLSFENQFSEQDGVGGLSLSRERRKYESVFVCFVFIIIFLFFIFYF